MTDLTPNKRPWLPHRPEQRFSVIVARFLEDALLQPCYKTAIHDADEGTRTDRQRARDKERGQEPGQLDWDIWQGQPVDDGVEISYRPLARKLELKRGKNKTSPNQNVTIDKLALLGAPPITAWSLREVHFGLAWAGFQFGGNVETLLQKYEAQLEAMDRTAEMTLAGQAPRKKSAPRKASPRYTAGKRMAKNMHARGFG